MQLRIHQQDRRTGGRGAPPHCMLLAKAAAAYNIKTLASRQPSHKAGMTRIKRASHDTHEEPVMTRIKSQA